MTSVATACACKKKHPLADPTAGGKLCGAETRQAEARYPTCHRPSGWGTDHPGEGKCKLHGGASRITHGRYASIQRPRLRELIAEHEADPDPLNIYPELAAARALFVDFIERYDEHTESLLAWHESYEATRLPLPEDKLIAFERVVTEYEIQLREGDDPTERQLADLGEARRFLDVVRGKQIGPDGTPVYLKPMKPRQILDVADAYRIVAEITKIAEREWKRQAEFAISRKDFFRLLEQFGRIVGRHVADPETLKRIRADWIEVSV